MHPDEVDAPARARDPGRIKRTARPAGHRFVATPRVHIRSATGRFPGLGYSPIVLLLPAGPIAIGRRAATGRRTARHLGRHVSTQEQTQVRPAADSPRPAPNYRADRQAHANGPTHWPAGYRFAPHERVRPAARAKEKSSMTRTSRHLLMPPPHRGARRVVRHVHVPRIRRRQLRDDRQRRHDQQAPPRELHRHRGLRQRPGKLTITVNNTAGRGYLTALGFTAAAAARRTTRTATTPRRAHDEDAFDQLRMKHGVAKLKPFGNYDAGAALNGKWNGGGAKRGVGAGAATRSSSTSPAPAGGSVVDLLGDGPLALVGNFKGVKHGKGDAIGARLTLISGTSPASDTTGNGGDTTAPPTSPTMTPTATTTTRSPAATATASPRSTSPAATATAAPPTPSRSPRRLDRPGDDGPRRRRVTRPAAASPAQRSPDR